MHGKLDQICQQICETCLECGQCIAECPLLQGLDENIIDIAKRQPNVEEAYSCTQCGLCEAVCPMSLSPKSMFTARRTQAVSGYEVSIDEYRYMFPDRKHNVMSLYRELNGFPYERFNIDQPNPVAFFPGCTMLTYSPELTNEVFLHLNQTYKGLTLLSECCGLPLYQLGLPSRGDNYVNSLKVKLGELKITNLIIACPNCYYQLRTVLKDTNLKLMTTYEALNGSAIFNHSVEDSARKVVTVHDSCPDRFGQIFAAQARNALQKKGYQLVEMEHSHQVTICCGSGAQITHFQPDLAESLVRTRLDEGLDTGAQILASSCLGCALNFSKLPSNIQVSHVLNLLLEFSQDFNGVKEKSKAIFEGPEGEKRWARVMEE